MRFVAPGMIFLLAFLVDRLLVLSLRSRYRGWPRILVAVAAVWTAGTLFVALLIPHEIRMSTAFVLLCTLPSAISLATMVFLVVLSPLWAPISAVARKRSEGVGVTRRELLRAVAVVPPVMVAAAGPVATLASGAAPILRRMTLSFPGLPPELDGFKLAQVSDAHVGYFVHAEDIAAAAVRIGAEKPDLVLVTGDLIDDLTQLDASLEALGTIPSRLGTFACMGNHEYYAGARKVRQAFDRSKVAMLVDERVRFGPLELSASDFSMVRRRHEELQAFEFHARKALDVPDPGAFRLHMAHHPHAWDATRALGADLTLSGHTHGGQIGVVGRAALEPIFRYVSGLYEDGPRKLYVSRGFGHWLPIRIACPTEIALITLRRG